MPSPAILITGCSTGIGHHLAHALHRSGHRVFATARREADVQRLTGEGLESLVLDLDSSDSIRAAVATVLERTGGRIDALINNGAFGLPGAVEDLSRDALRAQFETNLFGTQELTNLVLPVMRRQNHGRIIQLSSLLGIVCLAYRGAYSASKYALEALTDTMRLELRGTNIHLSLVEPGPITSRFRDNAYRAYQRWIDKTHSAHRLYYEAVERRLGGTKPLPFTLPPEAVLKRVRHALASRRPKARYPVTAPAYFFAAARHLLPTRALDRLLAAVSGGGRR
jgi:NAD(P)-dependent dehydrogenase (short-subunit alcohol dehydrogenase family)